MDDAGNRMRRWMLTIIVLVFGFALGCAAFVLLVHTNPAEPHRFIYEAF